MENGNVIKKNKETCVVYQGQELSLNENMLYLDGSLEEAAMAECPYLYNDIRSLIEAVNGKKEQKEPVTVYIAPGVYWIDDPDATDILQRKEGEEVPFGQVVECDTLKWIGLCEDAGQVILAGNRGQSHGANGNYTMFCFKVRDLELANLTIGNYCSIDLIYPERPQWNHARRTSAITQAQLGMQFGDKLLSTNCNFVSRLNLFPVSGGERCLYVRCHFESTDDALNGKAVYVDCDFDFYGNRPIYYTRDSGAVFLHCLFKGCIIAENVERKQYFTKEGGPVTVVDCEYVRQSPEREDAYTEEPGIAWTKYPAPSLRCYQSNMLCHGEQVLIAGEDAPETVCMDGKEILCAYKLEGDGREVYNTYNLLRGEDNWDPMQVRGLSEKAGRDRIPTLLTVEASGEEIISGETSISLKAQADYFYGGRAEDVRISYVVRDEDKAYVRLTDHGDRTCLAEGINGGDRAKDVVICAVTSQGLEGAVKLCVYPSLMEAPAFKEGPKVEMGAGVAKACYEADFSGYEDHSLISWYRCKDADGRDAVPVAVSRNDIPMKEYPLTRADVGYYLMIRVETGHIRSHRGEGSCAVSHRRVEEGDVGSVGGHRLVTDFGHIPTGIQDKILPGFWTMDRYRPADTAEFGRWEEGDSKEPWKYGETGNGSIGQGLYQGVQGARLMYTPLDGCYGDMTLEILADPAKTAGQGFGNAGQYMDLCVKFDTKTLTGYGVRILRSPEASDGVRFLFVKYDHGTVCFLNEGILTSCYHTGCRICISVEGNLLSVHARSEIAENGEKTKYASRVDMSVEIEENPFGGIAVQHTGTPGTGGWQNTTLLHELGIEWKGAKT